MVQATPWSLVASLQQLFVHPRRELKELYSFALLFSFASALITILEPVFFYKQGFPLAIIALYYALHYTLYGLLVPLGGKFAARYGLERSLALSVPIFVIYFLTLAALPLRSDLFWIAWILLTIHKIFYWPAYHAEFSTYGDRTQWGKELSWMNVVTLGAGIMGPLVGGIIATFFGFSTLFILAAIVALSASIPLLRTKERYTVEDFPYQEPWALLRLKRHRRMLIGMWGFAEELVDLVVWPIFLFIIVGTVDRLGLLVSVNILIMAVLGLLIGQVTDHYPRRTILRLHLPFMMLGYLFRPLATLPVGAFLTDMLARAAFIGVRIPLVSELYAKGKSVGALRYAVAFELALIISKAAAAWGLVVVFSMASAYTGFTVAFIGAAIAAMLYMFL